MKKFIITLLILFYVFPARGQEIQFTASVDKNTVTLDQTLTLTIRITSTNANIPGSPQYPALDGLRVVSGPSTSTNISFINGRVSGRKSYSYVLIPTREGRVTIGQAVFKLNNKEYKSRPIEIQVVKGSPAPQQPPKAAQPPGTQNRVIDLNKALFVRVFVDNRNPYQNEGVTVTYKIYTRVRVNSFGIVKPPTATGAWIEEYEIPQQPVLKTEVINGISYQTAVIKKLELFPTKTGELVLEPLVVQADAVIKRQRDIFNFNSFFNDDFFGRTVRRNLTAPSVKFQVKPLPPENKPSGFNNIVGKFSVKSEIDKTDVTTNEAVSLKIKITGSGNIKLIDAPNINISSDFEQYEPKSEEKINRTGNAITGEKIFEYVFLPRLAGRQKIGSAVFSYFDPKAKKYVTLRTKEITVNVAQGKDVVPVYPANLSRDEIKLIGTDIRFIKLKPLEWKRTDERFYTGHLFFIFIIAPLLLVGMTVLYNNHLERISSDVSYRRNRRASKAAEKRLKEANTHLQHNESEQFHAALSSALRGYIADKLNISEAGFLTNEVKEMLRRDRKSTRLNSSHIPLSRMPSSA